MLFRHVVHIKKVSDFTLNLHTIFPKLLCTALLLTAAQNTCFAFEWQDPFGTMNRVETPFAMKGSDFSNCHTQASADAVISLSDAVASSLCHNPKTKEAWATLQAQAAQVGIAQSAYLPNLSLMGQVVKNSSSNQGTNTIGQPFSYSSNSNNFSGSVNLNWVLYDFGLRSSVLDNAQKTLLSAMAKQDSVLQSVIANTVKDYYAALVAQKNIEATRQFETNAKQVLEMTTARVNSGVAAISDQLQAKTAYSQAVYNRHKAEGDWFTALGVVAIDMGKRPTSTLRLSASQHAQSPTIFVQSVDSLLQSAQETHPALRAARAERDAAEANETSITAQGRPSFSLIGQYSHNQQSESAGGGQPYIDTNRQGRYVGVKLDVPLFEGFGRTYKVRNAEAQTAVKQASLDSAELEVAVRVWTNYQLLQVNAINIQTSQEIVQSAEQAFKAAQSRYLRGVADIQELLNSQNTFANATQQQIKAVADWQNARIQMAASVGNLNITSIQ